MIVTVPKIRNEAEESSIRPDTTANWWQLVEERETEFVIEIMEE